MFNSNYVRIQVRMKGKIQGISKLCTDFGLPVTAHRAPRHIGGAFSMRWFTFIGEFRSRVGE